MLPSRTPGSPARTNGPVVAGAVDLGDHGHAGPPRGGEHDLALPGRRRASRRADRDDGADADPVERDHPADRTSAPGRATRRRPASRSGGRRRWVRAAPRRRRRRTPPAAGSAAPRRPRRPPAAPRPRRRCPRRPGACGTVSRWAPTTRCGRRGSKPGGVAITLTDVPASTGTPQELPPGTGDALPAHVVAQRRELARDPRCGLGGTPGWWRAADRFRPPAAGRRGPRCRPGGRRDGPISVP